MAGNPNLANTSASSRFSKIPKDEMKAIAKKGAAASAEAKRRNKELRYNLQKMLDGKYTVEDEEGNQKKLSGYELFALNAFINATTPSREQKDWWTLIRDTIGQKPKDELEITENKIIVDIDDADSSEEKDI